MATFLAVSFHPDIRIPHILSGGSFGFGSTWKGNMIKNEKQEICQQRSILIIEFGIRETYYQNFAIEKFNISCYMTDPNKIYWPSPVISMRLKWKRGHITWHVRRAASHRYPIKLRHYVIAQLYLRKVP